MVKFQICNVKKRYLKSKRVYQYKRISLNIPREFHEIIQSFLNKELQIKVSAQGGVFTIVLTRSEGTQ